MTITQQTLRGNTSRRSVIPVKPLLCNFIKITPRRGCHLAILRYIPQNTPKMEGLLPMHLQHTHRKY